VYGPEGTPPSVPAGDASEADDCRPELREAGVRESHSGEEECPGVRCSIPLRHQGADAFREDEYYFPSVYMIGIMNFSRHDGTDQVLFRYRLR